MTYYDEDDFLQLSGIQHFEFCRRQWALIHIEQQWEENFKTTSGKIMHKRAHNEHIIEKRGNKIIMRSLRVFSRELGISGECDIVEFHKDDTGFKLFGYEGCWKATPIEYKRGTVKIGIEDEVQLCAQAICLEEIFLTKINTGYLFYGENKRRTEVYFNKELREKVKKICSEMHSIYDKGYTPKVNMTKKCDGCSLKEICLPILNKKNNVNKYIEERLFEDGKKV